MANFGEESGDVFLSVENLGIKFAFERPRAPTLKEFIVSLGGAGKRERASDEYWALRGIGFRLEPGDKLAIVGRNGAGKSTLLRAISGIYPPAEGEIRGSGDILSLLELGTGFDLTRTARENVYLCGATLGYSISQMNDRMADIVAFAELSDFVDSPVSHLSSGMRSRLAFSIAVSTEPDILLLDEVFAAGDAVFLKKARSRMYSLVESSKILVFVSHTDSLVRDICNRALLLDKGRMLLIGGVDEVLVAYEQEAGKVT